MILSPAYPINLKSVDLLLFADNPHQTTGSIFKLSDDHSNQAALQWFLKAGEERDQIGMIVSDLRAFTSTKLPQSTPAVIKKRQSAFNAAIKLLLRDLGIGMLQIGTEVNPKTLDVSYWLVLYGSQEMLKVPLTMVKRAGL